MNNNISHSISEDTLSSKKPLNSKNINNICISEFYDATDSISLPAAKTRNITAKIVYTMVFAILMAISANTFTYLPFTPVPFTMQVLTVLLSAVMLGSRLALFSQLQYVFAGLLGAPVFAGFKNGLLLITGPTVGYVIGFIAAAFITGYIYENNITGAVLKSFKVPAFNNFRQHYDSRSISMFISCLLGVLVIHSCGFIYLYGFICESAKAAGSLDIFKKSLKLGVVPFIIIDFLKILIIINLNKVFKIKDQLKK
jgi:biotin transporter BioY